MMKNNLLWKFCILIEGKLRSNIFQWQKFFDDEISKFILKKLLVTAHKKLEKLYSIKFNLKNE